MRSALIAVGTLAVGMPVWAQAIPVVVGPGDDTEAAWSPDGRRVAFQRELEGDVDLYAVDLATRIAIPLVSGPGHACHPAWSPDGKQIAYSFAHFERTAAAGLDSGYNLFVVPASGGEPRRLTGGVARDYTPTFSPDGQYIYFSSTRGSREASVGLYRVPVEGGEPERVLLRDTGDTAFVQPTFSPDGRLICCGYIAGFRSNWTLRLIRLADMAEYPLTDPTIPLYGPRWSPDGEWIACTGYQPGDEGWRVCLIHASTGRPHWPATGPGNSRSPVWSPDGTELIFENNRSGQYKLYRMPVRPVAVPGPGPESAAESVARLPFGAVGGDVVPDLSGQGNDGAVVGEVGWTGEGATFAQGCYVTIPEPKGCDFGAGEFSVKVTVSVERHTDELRLIIVGDYPTNHLGWQIFLNDENHAYFNSRAPDGRFVGAKSDEPLPVGRPVTLIGLRRRLGRVELHVDGILQHSVGAGATMAYPAPNQIRIGSQFNGTAPFIGTVRGVEVYAGALGREQIRGTSLQEFLAR